MDKPFDPSEAIERALTRLGDLYYPMGDVARAVITGQGGEPTLESDAAALARRIAQEELDRARIEQGFEVEGY